MMNSGDEKESEKLLTTAVLAAETGYSIRAVQKWCSSGKLQAQMVGRDYLIRRQDWQLFECRYSPVKRSRIL